MSCYSYPGQYGGWEGSIDLNTFKVYVDGNLVYQPCLKIPYTESKTGSKIVPAYARNRVIDMYEQEGYAGYYTIQEGKKGNYVVVGSPTISEDGVVSGLSLSDGIQVPMPILENANDWDIIIPFEMYTTSTEHNFFIWEGQESVEGGTTYTGICCRIYPGNRLRIKYNYGTGDIIQISTVSLQNGNYLIKLSFKNGVLKAYVKSTGSWEEVALWSDVVKSIPASLNTKVPYGKIGLFDTRYLYKKSFDVNAFKIYVDGELVYKAFTPPNYTLPMGDVYGVLSAKSNSSEISRYSMPSDKYIDLTLGESGSTYTAPANGWFTCFIGSLTTAGYLNMKNNANKLVSEIRSTITGTAVSGYVPVQKGQSITVSYDAVGNGTIFRFIYAEGEV